MKNYDVTVPIAGHAVVTIAAESEEDAVNRAIEFVEFSDISEWEALIRFNQGNICYCPQPWEAEAVLAAGEDDEEAA